MNKLSEQIIQKISTTETQGICCKVIGLDSTAGERVNGLSTPLSIQLDLKVKLYIKNKDLFIDSFLRFILQ